mmetsp:Transcript_22262/g.55849  ORF Transcript_22262/g.55849 Transcript_22262/m.55849 type:complete len:287 (-) Transcript_22262:126-986(-)
MEEVVISRAGDNGENEMAQSDWDHCRREARRLESEIETKLVAYSKFSANYRQSASESALLLSAAPSAPAHDSSVSSVSSPSAGSSHLPDPSAGAVPASPFSGQEHINATMSLEIERCLERLAEVNAELNHLLSGPESRRSAQLMPLLLHHRSKLHDYQTDFRTTKENINRTRDHAELLMTVREDINQFKNTSASSRAETLLRERNALHSSGRAVDDLIEHAVSTRDHLSNQKSRLQSSFAQVNTFGGAFSGIQGLLSGIRTRTMRDKVILAMLVATCICFLLWWGL